MPEPRAEALKEVGMAFRRADRSLRRLRGRDAHLCAGELSHARLELLGELFERGPLPASDLAAAAEVSPATVSQLLDRLEGDDYVERVRSEADRRVVLVELTDHGRAQVEERKAAWRRRWREALREVETAELETAARVLDRIAAVFESPED